jgi:hypothetical protein
MDAVAAGHDAAVQMIDTSVVRVHQHNNQQDMGRCGGASGCRCGTARLRQSDWPLQGSIGGRRARLLCQGSL